jgi:hypothetical protein
MIDRGEMDKRFYVSSFDGLRAIGILSIIIYSLYSYRLPGGFLGLDIFLILAGYFMTNRLMMSLMAEGKIPLKQILLKRLARIALPLIAMLILVFIYITLFQNEMLVNLRGSFTSSLVFLNNWWQIFRAQMFIPNLLTENPFEHLWYISLAFQFYLLWPIVFAFLSLFLKKYNSLFIAIMLFVMGSFALMVFSYKGEDSLTYVTMSTSTRLFSMLIGSSTALLYPLDCFQREYKSKLPYEQYLRWIPIILMFVLMFTLTQHDSMTYRGGMLIFDLTVACVILVSIHPKVSTGILFRLKPLTIIGRRSLSYYLWFLPIVVLYQAKMGITGNSNFIQGVIQFVLIVFFGELWYQIFEKKRYLCFIQKNIRILKNKTPYSKQILFVFCAMPIVILAIGLVQSTSKLSEQESKLTELIQTNQQIVQNTQVVDKKDLKTINNVQGLTREETVYSSNSSITFIGDQSLLAIADKLTTIYPNAIMHATTTAQLYEISSTINELKTKHQLNDIVVLMFGFNGAFTNRQLESELKRMGMEKQIFLVTTTTYKTWRDEVNEVDKSISDKYSNVYLLDWNEYSKNQDWFYSRKAYVTDVGAQEQTLFFAKKIYETLRGN